MEHSFMVEQASHANSQGRHVLISHDHKVNNYMEHVYYVQYMYMYRCLQVCADDETGSDETYVEFV